MVHRRVGRTQPREVERNVSLDVIRAAGAYWRQQGWISPDPSADPAARLRRHRVAPDRSRALSRAEVQRLLTDEKYPLRERLLWRLLYESAARSAEVLRLNVEDLDMPNRLARVRRKGGAVDVIAWQTGTARLLPRYLAGRKTGPLFVTERRSRLELSPADLDERGGPGSAMSRPGSCSKRQRRERRCTSCGTRR